MTELTDTANAAIDFIRRLTSAWECCGTCAGGVLAAHDAAIRAEALEEAATAWHDRQVTLHGDITGYERAKGARWWLVLRAEALRATQPTEGES